MKKIAVLVVTYNRKKLLLENLEALRMQTVKEFDLYLIDNNSTDGTQEMVQQLNIPNLYYINTGANLGGAGGFSFGLNEIFKKEYEYCWIMDDDTIPSKTALESLCNKAKILNNKFSFLGSLVQWTDGNLCEMNIPGRRSSMFKDVTYLQHHLLKVATSSFVSLFINVKLAKKVGLPIKEFFIYGDDYEYTMRLSKEEQGYWDLDSKVLHKMSVNQGIDIAKESEERLERHYYNIRNLTYVAKKYGWKGIPNCMWRVLNGSFNILLHAKTKKVKRVGILVRGFFAGLRFNPSIVTQYK